MTDFLTLALSRRSIRKFEPTPIPEEHIRAMVEAAHCAPSGCNSQCWQFVAVTGQPMREKLAQAVREGIRSFFEGTELADDEAFLQGREKAFTFFQRAPLVFLVFLDHMDYYEKKTLGVYERRGIGHRDMMDRMGYPDVLSVGAAVENLLLQAQQLGYGACWMNDPIMAEKQIKAAVGADDSLRLMSVIPVGVPAYTPREKVQKPLEQVLRIL